MNSSVNPLIYSYTHSVIMHSFIHSSVHLYLVLDTRSWLSEPGCQILKPDPGHQSMDTSPWLSGHRYEILAARFWIPDPGLPDLATRSWTRGPGCQILDTSSWIRYQCLSVRSLIRDPAFPNLATRSWIPVPSCKIRPGRQISDNQILNARS